MYYLVISVNVYHNRVKQSHIHVDFVFCLSVQSWLHFPVKTEQTFDSAVTRQLM